MNMDHYQNWQKNGYMNMYQQQPYQQQPLQSTQQQQQFNITNIQANQYINNVQQQWQQNPQQWDYWSKQQQLKNQQVNDMSQQYMTKTVQNGFQPQDMYQQQGYQQQSGFYGPGYFYPPTSNNLYPECDKSLSNMYPPGYIQPPQQKSLEIPQDLSGRQPNFQMNNFMNTGGLPFYPPTQNHPPCQQQFNQINFLPPSQHPEHPNYYNAMPAFSGYNPILPPNNPLTLNDDPTHQKQFLDTHFPLNSQFQADKSLFNQSTKIDDQKPSQGTQNQSSKKRVASYNQKADFNFSSDQEQSKDNQNNDEDDASWNEASKKKTKFNQHTSSSSLLRKAKLKSKLFLNTPVQNHDHNPVKNSSDSACPGNEVFLNNHKRNTFKNLTNQIISFVQSQKGQQLLYKIKNLLQIKDQNFIPDFKSFSKSYIRKIFTIQQIKDQLWDISEKHTSNPNYKVMRIISKYFLEREATSRIITSKAVKNKNYHLSIKSQILSEIQRAYSTKK